MAGVGTAPAAQRPARRRVAGVDQHRMAGVASFSVAVAAWSAALAISLPAGGRPLAGFVIVGAMLAIAVGVVLAGRTVVSLPAGKDVLLLTCVTAAGVVAVNMAGWASREHVGQIAYYLPLVVAGLSVFWPAPNVLRYCVLLTGGALLAGPRPSKPALGLALAALAVALVATNRLAAAAAPRLGDAPPVRARRLAGESAAVLVVVGLLAALAASLVPPPPGDGGGMGSLLAEAPGPLPQPPAPAIDFDDRLDMGAGRGKPSDEYVLFVVAREPDVWRAVTYDRWDGESWSRSPARTPIEEDDPVEPGIGDRPSDPDGDFDPSDLYQRITILARSAHILVAAPLPMYASAAGGDLEQGADASLYPSAPLARGDSYFVLSDRTAASAAELRALGDTPAAAVPADVARAYLQLTQLPSRVRQLAAELAAGESTTFDKARAVERWIDRNTTVTDDAAPVPAGADALETFLLEDRAGPPERAATAMAVMLRSVGVPARLAIGYLPGHRDRSDRPFTVRASDVHAWVEVWFPTVGWQRFDPTGRAPDPRPEPESVWDRLLRFLRRLWPLLVVLVVAGAGWLAWRLAAWRRRQAALPWATRYFTRLERAGRARGRPRRPPETPAEYTRALAEEALPDPRLGQVGELVTVAAWSRHEPPAEEKTRAEAVLKAAKKAAPVPLLRRRRQGRPTIAKP